MTQPYVSTYWPPFPKFDIFVEGPIEKLGPMQALLDTGADTTIVPIEILLAISAREVGSATLRSHFGEAFRVQRYAIDIIVEGISLPGIYVVGDENGDEIILGRDVLNKLPIFLDGPARQTHLLDEATVKRLRTRRPG